MTFDGRRPSVEDDLQWKMTFGGRRPVVEEDLQWKINFNRRQPVLDPCMLPTPLFGIFSEYALFTMLRPRVRRASVHNLKNKSFECPQTRL